MPVPHHLAVGVALLAAVVATRFAPTAAQTTPSAKPPSLDQVLARLNTYLPRYGPQLNEIVAEEEYTQALHNDPGTVLVPPVGATRRVIKSDFVLTRSGDDHGWVAFRDAFEVDGERLRDREDRLVALVSSGDDRAWRRAAALATESARFNIGSRLVMRNINVPTFVVQLLSGPNRQRFRYSMPRPARGAPPLTAEDGAALVQIEFRERDRPTIVRQNGGGDQPLRGTIDVHPQTGDVWRTHLTWERGPAGYIDVTFGRVPNVDVLVPLRMTEGYRSGRTTISGEATYSNFRRFQTSAHVVQ